MVTTEQRSKIGKQNKRKGHAAEAESAKFWSKELDTTIRRTPRSGGFAMDFKGEIFDTGNSILKNFIVERKFGQQVPKKIEQWMEKLRDESQGKMNFLELSRPYEETYIIISRKQFARLLKELQGYRKEHEK